MRPSLSQSTRRRALIGLAALMLVALAGGCPKERAPNPAGLTAPWTDMGLPLGPDILISASNSEGFEGSGKMPTAWPVLAQSIQDKLERDGWTTDSEPYMDKTGYDARMRKGDKGLLIGIGAIPNDRERSPFTISVKKYWPAGKPSAEW
jgi:hypothetical protein